MRAKGLWFGLAALVAGSPAWALDLTKIDKQTLKLDVTEASFLVQRFDSRTLQGEPAGDGGFGYWINRLNLALTWGHFSVGGRLDSSLWWRQPHDQSDNANETQRTADSYRFPQTLYAPKLWATYNAPGVEVTFGDAYVQFARGLTISMRKLDDLGIDNTVRGGKVAISKGPFVVTAVAGFANPSRVDESSGQTLFLQQVPTYKDSTNNDPSAPHPVFGSDRVLGAEIQAGRGLPIVLATSAVRYNRCAPYAYDSNKNKFVTDGAALSDSLFGTCDDTANQAWIEGLGRSAPTRQATTIDMVSQAIEVPKMGPLGSIYVVGAIQRRSYQFSPDLDGAGAEGNALYASYSGSYGPITNTFEFKSYRNFRPVVASVNEVNGKAFSFVSYSTPPTTEILTQDNLGTNDFNACATGGRLRTDVRMNKQLLAYFQGIYAVTKSEQSGTSCDKYGDLVGGKAKNPDSATNYVWDGTAGIQFNWDESRSYFYGLINARDDVRGDGQPYLRQDDFEYTFSGYLGKGVAKKLHAPASIELTGRNRLRYQADENFALSGGKGVATRWFEGENYVALKLAPKWVVTGGVEYTTKQALPTWYPNASVLYKFTSDSNLKFFVGEQRGGLKCVSGVCRIFPAFEGARLELTMRF